MHRPRITAVDRTHAPTAEIAGVAGTAAVPTTFGYDIDSAVDAVAVGHRLRRNKPWAALDRTNTDGVRA
ncbi:hypothetical protein [Streptomyces sp.]|uniref:hypothetical protein n=1 Tax=Streptomyces sp. TaxID=1931 RepID=UPI002F3E5628